MSSDPGEILVVDYFLALKLLKRSLEKSLEFLKNSSCRSVLARHHNELLISCRCLKPPSQLHANRQQYLEVASIP